MQTQGESKPDSGSRQAAEHVKKQEQPQTHEDGEAQKLVERIEKKVSDQKPNRAQTQSQGGQMGGHRPRYRALYFLQSAVQGALGFHEEGFRCPRESPDPIH